MRTWILLGALLLSGCASHDVDGEPRTSYSPLREAFSGAKWGPWTPEFPPR